MAAAVQPVQERFPRPVLWAAAALLGCTIALAAIGRMTGVSEIPANVAAAQVRNLRFADAAGGAVAVTDADTGKLVQTITGQAGFLRGTLRGLAGARKREGQGQDVPFRLTAWKDGRLTLDDPATGRHIELEAFGATNEAAFATLLQPQGAPR